MYTVYCCSLLWARSMASSHRRHVNCKHFCPCSLCAREAKKSTRSNNWLMGRGRRTRRTRRGLLIYFVDLDSLPARTGLWGGGAGAVSPEVNRVSRGPAALCQRDGTLLCGGAHQRARLRGGPLLGAGLVQHGALGDGAALREEGAPVLAVAQVALGLPLAQTLLQLRLDLVSRAHTHTHARTQTNTYTYTYTYTHIHTQMCRHTNTHTHKYKHMHSQTWMHMPPMHTDIHMHKSAHTHTDADAQATHTHIHAHIHAIARTHGQKHNIHTCIIKHNHRAEMRITLLSFSLHIYITCLDTLFLLLINHCGWNTISIFHQALFIICYIWLIIAMSDT